MTTRPLNTSLANKGITADNTNKVSKVQMRTDSTPAYSAGQIGYDADCKCHLFDTGFTDVRVNVGRENQVLVFNNTGAQIDNGKAVSVTGVVNNGVPEVALSTKLTEISALSFAGVATMDIPDGETGIVTSFGLVGGIDTSSYSVGFIYVDTDGDYTQIRPQYPYHRRLVGGVLVSDASDGIISVNPQALKRRSTSRTYPFTSATVAAGVSYQAGFYDWAPTSVTLTQASLTQTYGTANLAKAAHVGIVPQAAGTVDAGQVGLRVTGTLDTELGTQTAAQTAIITDDITTLTANVMAETSEKFSGTVTYELYVVSGSPTTYSLTFNYGFSKYEDVLNTDGTVVGIDCVWEAGAADTSFNIELLHHKATGWTYAASGFVPGDGAICERLVDQAISGNTATGKFGAWKRVNLNTFIEGRASEGIIIRITTGANNSIRNLTMHVSAFSEEIE